MFKKSVNVQWVLHPIGGEGWTNENGPCWGGLLSSGPRTNHPLLLSRPENRESYSKMYTLIILAKFLTTVYESYTFRIHSKLLIIRPLTKVLDFVRNNMFVWKYGLGPVNVCCSAWCHAAGILSWSMCGGGQQHSYPTKKGLHTTASTAATNHSITGSIAIRNYDSFLNYAAICFILRTRLKVPSHQIRSAWKLYGWTGLNEYKDPARCTDY